jgi:hypothetical protein
MHVRLSFKGEKEPMKSKGSGGHRDELFRYLWQDPMLDYARDPEASNHRGNIAKYLRSTSDQLHLAECTATAVRDTHHADKFSASIKSCVAKCLGMPVNGCHLFQFNRSTIPVLLPKTLF